MTSKERRKLKHDLKTRIDYVDTLIVLSNMGVSIGATSPENLRDTRDTRETLVTNLTMAKIVIAANCEKFIAEIDKAIEKMQ